MSSRLTRTYLSLFRDYPILLPFALITATSQAGFALLAIYALPVYFVQDLHLSGTVLGAASPTAGAWRGRSACRWCSPLSAYGSALPLTLAAFVAFLTLPPQVRRESGAA